MSVKKPAIIILLSFVAVAVFGFLCMGLSAHTEKNPCPIHSVAEASCATAETGSTHALHHLMAFKNNIAAILTVNVMTLVFSLLVFTAFASVGIRPGTHPGSFINKRFQRLFSPVERELFWSALHNKRGMKASLGC